MSSAATGVHSGAAQPVPQLRYALVLEWATRIGLIFLAVSFAAYVAGWLPGQVPPAELPQLWSLSSQQYVSATGTPTGWGWLKMLHHGDMLSLVGIVFLSASSAVALLSLVPLYLMGRERWFVFLSVAQVLVLFAAALGVLA